MDVRMRPRIFNGIIDQVGEHLPEQFGMCVDNFQMLPDAVDIDVKGKILGVQCGRKVLACFTEHFSQCDLLNADRFTAKNHVHVREIAHESRAGSQLPNDTLELALKSIPFEDSPSDVLDRAE